MSAPFLAGLSRDVSTWRVSDNVPVPWDALNDYELRNVPAHLASRARWKDLRDMAFDTGYLRVALRRLGLAELTRVLAELISARVPPPWLRADLAHLRELVAEEAGFLAAGQYVGYDGAFCDHLALAWIRRFPGSRSPLWCDLADVDQEGWLDLVGQRGGPLKRATRFFMPGQRESHGWDYYDSGPAGVSTSLAVDLRRMRLLGQSISLFYSDSHGYLPEEYHWRIWDLRTGAQLYERSVASPSRDMVLADLDDAKSVDGRPAAFEDPGLARGTRKVIAVLKCANGEEQLFVGSRDNDTVHVTATDSGQRRLLLEARISSSIGLKLLIRLDDQLVLLGVGTDKHIYRVDLGGGDTPEFGESPLAPPGVTQIKWLNGSWTLAETGSGEPARAKELTLEPPLGPQASDRRSTFQEGFLESSGRYLIKRNTSDIGIWHYPSGRWADHLAVTNDRSGGGGILRGCSVTPDGSHLISHAANVCVWNLDELDRGEGTMPGGHYRLPHWRLKNIELPGPLTRLAFFWGGWLVAAVTEQHELLILRFRRNSAILARVGLDDEVKELRGDPYGPAITCVGTSGRASTYRFRFLSEPHVSVLRGRMLALRLQRPAARSVQVAGSFTEWQARPLLPGAHGIWHGEFDLPDGDHEYKFLLNGKTWELDPHVPFRPGPLAPNNYITVLPDGRPRLASATSTMAFSAAASPSSRSRKSAKDR
jgi:hypothetical protein